MAKTQNPPFSTKTKTGYVLVEIVETLEVVTLLVIPKKELTRMQKLQTKPDANDPLWLSHF